MKEGPEVEVVMEEAEEERAKLDGIISTSLKLRHPAEAHPWLCCGEHAGQLN